MAYIGNQPTDNFVTFATQNFTTSATSSYTLSHAVSNENEIALFINNVRQHPGSGKAYTASGTALTLSANTASTDVMYCIFLGRAIQSTVPATNSITNAMITDSTIESGKLFSTFKNGITNAQQWRISGNQTGLNEGAFVTDNWEEVDTDGYGRIGSLMTQSSGEFTFPTTGRWLIHFVFVALGGNQTQQYVGGKIRTTSNNSSYDVASEGYNTHGIANSYSSTCTTFLFAVSGTTTHKVKFSIAAQQSGVTAIGSTANSITSVTFTRLGDI